jgi:hypothetical protein
MLSKRSRLLVTTLAVLCLLSTMPVAAAELLSGTVQQVNMREGTLTLSLVDGRTVELTASASLLNDVQTGDAVEIQALGQHAMVLYMKGAPPQLIQPGGFSQRPAFGGPVVPPRS